MLALEVLQKLGLDNVELRLSHADLIRALLARFGLSPGEQARVFDQILDGDLEVLARLKPEKPELGRTLTPLLDFKGKSSGFLKNMEALLVQELPELEPALDNFIAVTDLLEALGYNYQIDIASGRGFEYYTGVIFQLFAAGEHIGGGGRYDNLIPQMGGRSIPASGFALYVDHLMNLIMPTDLAEPQKPGILIETEPMGTDAWKETFSLMNRFHEAGYMAEMQLGNRKPVGLRWWLEVQDKAPRFALTDQATGKRFQVGTVNEVIKLLQKNG
jgi:histidyl-tRNA synthetase